MSTSYTRRIRLAKPGPADRGWNVPLNANADALDALAPVGGLCVSTTETPSTTLRAQAAAGRFQRPDGAVGSSAGSASIALVANATNHVYLLESGEPATSTVGFPTTSHVPLAVVVATDSAVESVTDARVPFAMVGSGSRPFLTAAGGALNDGATFPLGTAVGLKLGTSPSQKLGFWNAAPIARPGPYTQSYSVNTRSVAPYSPVSASVGYVGIGAGQGGSPYAQVVDLNNLRAAHENLRALSENTIQLLNGLINDLKAMGLLG